MRILSLLFVLGFWTVNANACSCDWSRNFLDLCTESDVVVQFHVKGYADYEMIGSESVPRTLVVEINQVYKGLIPSIEMRFSGDDGTLCRKYVKHFNIGGDYYFQYNNPTGIEIPILDICGEYDLLIDNDVVAGDEFQENSTQKMTSDEFQDALEDQLGDLANPSFYPLSNLNDGTARTYSNALLYTLFGVLVLLIAFFVRVLNKSRVA